MVARWAAISAASLPGIGSAAFRAWSVRPRYMRMARRSLSSVRLASVNATTRWLWYAWT